MSISSVFARNQPKTFRVSYSPQYNYFFIPRILNDKQHPLYESRLRESQNRKKEKLWWHATTGNELSKSSVVRSWCRRRLRNAFTEVLQERGFDEHGMLVKDERVM